ncbi:MAG TPA: hypothetical protein VJR58_29015 [Vineibacter sp.]|nr:hypothetical protein [Vineibacter sp.]
MRETLTTLTVDSALRRLAIVASGFTLVTAMAVLAWAILVVNL